MAAPIFYPTIASARPVNPLVTTMFPTMAGEYNDANAYIAELLFPHVNAGIKNDSGDTGTIQTIAADEMIKVHSTVRAPGASIQMAGGVQLNPLTFQCVEHSEGDKVPSRTADMTQGVNLYSATVANVWHGMKLEMEDLLNTFLFTTAWHPSDGNAPAAWDAATGDPMKDIAKAVRFVPGANVIAMNREVFFAMATNTLMRGNIGNDTDRTFIDLVELQRMLLAKFGLILLVSNARKSVSGTESYALTDSAWVGRVSGAPVQIGPMTFRVNGSAGSRMSVSLSPTKNSSRASQLGDWLMEEWSEPGKRSDLFSLGHCDVLKQTSAVGGFAIGNLIT